VIKGKLIQQAANNTKEQFANSPDLAQRSVNAILDAFAAHSSLNKQAVDPERVRDGLKDILLGPARLYETLREQWGAEVEAGN
jgi:type I restriction enzyme R subunit